MQTRKMQVNAGNILWSNVELPTVEFYVQMDPHFIKCSRVTEASELTGKTGRTTEIRQNMIFHIFSSRGHDSIDQKKCLVTVSTI